MFKRIYKLRTFFKVYGNLYMFNLFVFGTGVVELKCLPISVNYMSIWVDGDVNQTRFVFVTIFLIQ